MNIKEVQNQLKSQGLQERASQLEMIQDVYETVENKRFICIEAPTGTGKTISYCLGAYLAKDKKQSIIISTSTIALQEQLIKKDLPLLSKILDQKIQFTLAKGRRRYVCRSRLDSPQSSDIFSESNEDFDELRSEFDKGRWNGDRDELDLPVSEEDWRRISTDSAGCHGKHCQFYEQCAFFTARKKIHHAEIIVVNHSLLLSDLELGGGAILPEPEKCIYVIDECHHLPEKALSHFAKSDSLMASVDWINTLTKNLTTALKEKLITSAFQKKMNSLTHELVQSLNNMQQMITLNEARFEEDIWRIKDVDQSMFDTATPIVEHAKKVKAHCENLCAEFDEKLSEKNRSPEERLVLEKLVANIGFITGRLEHLLETWRLFLRPREKQAAPIARWFEKRGQSYFCHASPINVSDKLKTLFWEKAKQGVVLCSATVRTLGGFDDFRRKTGLKDCESCAEKQIESCFDYQKSVLFVPSMQHEPSGVNQEGHRKEVAEILPQLILPEGGTLVLFASRDAMMSTYEVMPDKIFQDILIQKPQNKNKLIETHKKRIGSGKRSIIFGLASFGEGVDLPASLCQHVIIHKLPFAVPSTPIELTRNEWLKSNRLNAFMLSSLPRASIRLTQYVGRLLRQEEDFGIVSILDKRLYAKQYGSHLLQNLPDFQRLIDKNIDALKKISPVTLVE